MGRNKEKARWMESSSMGWNSGKQKFLRWEGEKTRIPPALLFHRAEISLDHATWSNSSKTSGVLLPLWSDGWIAWLQNYVGFEVAVADGVTMEEKSNNGVGSYLY